MHTVDVVDGQETCSGDSSQTRRSVVAREGLALGGEAWHHSGSGLSVEFYHASSFADHAHGAAQFVSFSRRRVSRARASGQCGQSIGRGEMEAWRRPVCAAARLQLARLPVSLPVDIRRPRAHAWLRSASCKVYAVGQCSSAGSCTKAIPPPLSLGRGQLSRAVSLPPLHAPARESWLERRGSQPAREWRGRRVGGGRAGE